MIQVILNADDFGRSIERNRAINDSFKQGLIRSAGLIVTGKYLQNAIDYINNGGYIKHIHLHINLSTNIYEGNPEDIPVTEIMRNDPFFCENGRFKNYNGLPTNFTCIREWVIVYRELVAQYEKFIEITSGKANYKHIDFHLWYNLTWPVSVALYFFSKKYKIKSVRFIGLHQMVAPRYRLLSWISNPKKVKYFPATNIDYYVTKRQSLVDIPIVELYCHPNYKDGVFLDDSPSYLKHDRQPLLKQINMLNELEDLEYISWEDVL